MMNCKAYLTTLVYIVFINTIGQSEGYGFSYNYFDQMAQNYCASQHQGWIFALRRDCSGTAPTCNDICQNAKVDILNAIGNQKTNVLCYDGFHIKKSHPTLLPNPGTAQPDAGKVNLGTYGYGAGACTWTPNHCGPNYCCCKAY